MTTNKNIIINFFLIIFILSLVNPAFVASKSTMQRVIEVCKCYFSAEIGGYKNFKAIKVRYALFRNIPGFIFMVQEILSERKGEMYRMLSTVISTERSTVGRVGTIIEIVKLNGPYFPAQVIF